MLEGIKNPVERLAALHRIHERTATLLENCRSNLAKEMTAHYMCIVEVEIAHVEKTVNGSEIPDEHFFGLQLLK